MQRATENFCVSGSTHMTLSISFILWAFCSVHYLCPLSIPICISG